MFIISDVFSFEIWKKIVKMSKFNNCKIKHVYGSLTIFLDFTQKI